MYQAKQTTADTLAQVFFLFFFFFFYKAHAKQINSIIYMQKMPTIFKPRIMLRVIYCLCYVVELNAIKLYI